MDHDAVQEILELATAEPDGLDRLMAGDTAAAQAVAAHLAGCAECTLELGRLRRLGAVVRDTVATTPSPDLRDRTLAYVRQHGVPRGPAIAPRSGPIELPVAASAPQPIAGPRIASRGRTVATWVASVAAAVVLSVVATTVIVDGRLEKQDAAIEDLAAVTTATLHVTAEHDVARIGLASPNGGATTGTLLFSPSTTQVVVVADGLIEPAAGMEYRCWVMVGSKRQSIGRMFFGGGLAYWVGPSPAVAGLAGGATFGVSLVAADGGTVAPDPVLTGGT
jgi:Anti-sigma-K factor rskA